MRSPSRSAAAWRASPAVPSPCWPPPDPTTGQQYIVDTFIVVVFGGVESLLGTIVSAFIIGQMQSWFEYPMSGSMARASILLLVIVVLYFRPNGLFATKVRRLSTASMTASATRPPRRAPRRNLWGMGSFLLLAVLLLVVFPLRWTCSGWASPPSTCRSPSAQWASC